MIRHRYDIYSEDKMRRLSFFLRDNETYYFEKQKFSSEPLEMLWIPVSQNPIGFYKTLEEAVDVAEADLAWLNEES